MQAKTVPQQSSQSKDRIAQAQPGLAGEQRSRPEGSVGLLLSLQRSHGNRFVQRFLNSTLLQRDCGCGGTCADCNSNQNEDREVKRIQRNSTVESGPSQVPALVYEVLGSSGQPLDVSTRSFMETRFGHDFKDVRIRTGTKASESAQAVSARAFTVGHDIVFADGQYAPGSEQGRHLLAHELAHTVQQSHASPGPISGISQPGDPSEREADQVADEVMRMPEPPSKQNSLDSDENGRDLEASRFPCSGLQRQDDDASTDGQPEEDGFEAGGQIIMLRPRWRIATVPEGSGSGTQSSRLAGGSGSLPVLQRDGCDQPSSMRKVTSGTFEGGKTLDDYYPDLKGSTAWGSSSKAGPFDNGTRAGSAVQLISDYPSPCTAQGSGFTFSQSATTVRFRANGKKVKENGKVLEGTTLDDMARSGRDQSKAPFRQGFSFAVSIADPISGMEYKALTSYEFEVNLTTSVSGGGTTKSVDWGITVEASGGKVTKNEVR